MLIAMVFHSLDGVHFVSQVLYELEFQLAGMQLFAYVRIQDAFSLLPTVMQ